MKRDRVLLVDDEPKLVRLVRTVLSTAGYDVLVSGEGREAVEMAAMEQPDLVILDVLLSTEIDGYEVCRRIREFSDVPVIMLTAKAREEDKLEGFARGADDYLTKPFSAKELLARVKALIWRSRRRDPSETASHLELGELEMDLLQRRVVVRGQDVRLTATEYELLRHLASNAGRVLSHEDLLTRVWGPEYRDEVDYLRNYVRFLRRKIEANPKRPRIIVSHPGVGYQLVRSTKEETAPDGPS